MRQTFYWRGKRRAANRMGLHIVPTLRSHSVNISERTASLLSAFAKSRGVSVRAAADAILSDLEKRRAG